MEWTVYLSRKVEKQLVDFQHEDLLCVFRLLVDCLKIQGPAPGKEWPHYGKLRGKKAEDKRHCHLIHGRPTYACCWEVIDVKKRITEVYYVGTHEKAPY